MLAIAMQFNTLYILQAQQQKLKNKVKLINTEVPRWYMYNLL